MKLYINEGRLTYTSCPHSYFRYSSITHRLLGLGVNNGLPGYMRREREGSVDFRADELLAESLWW